MSSIKGGNNEMCSLYLVNFKTTITLYKLVLSKYILELEKVITKSFSHGSIRKLLKL